MDYYYIFKPWQSIRVRCDTFLWYIFVIHFCDTFLWYIFVIYFCNTFLWNIFVIHFCDTFLCYIFVIHFYIKRHFVIHCDKLWYIVIPCDTLWYIALFPKNYLDMSKLKNRMCKTVWNSTCDQTGSITRNFQYKY